jgi:uncharacterized caspase-like protein
MTNFEDASDAISAKHLFFVMDACYSGLALTRAGGGARSGDRRQYLMEITRRSAREVLTAGGGDEQVADNGPNGHSIFTWTLLQGLEGRADLDNENDTVRNYRQRVAQCEAMGEYGIAEDIREILRQEQEHQIDLATALGEDVARYRAGQKVEAHRETAWERTTRVAHLYRVPILLVLAYMVMRTIVAFVIGR